MATRRSLLKGAIGGLLAAGATLEELPSWAAAAPTQPLEPLSGKAPLLRRAYRPPNFETPPSGFAAPITPNDQFFVRWHLADIPRVDPKQWTLRVGGPGANQPLQLTLDELKSGFDAVDVVAVCQCAGNRRAYSQPRVPGVQWGSGAVGNARWTGVRLRDVLARAGLADDAVEVAFHGMDQPLLDATPAFVKSLPTWKAVEDSTIIAYAMNGAPLPHWNGFPARLVVPGWVATYWMKQITTLDVLKSPLKNFWMNTAYRIPKGQFPADDRFASQVTEANAPITEMVVNSMITSHAPGQRVKAGRAILVSGVAWDGGYGIQQLDVSIDGGQTWEHAALGADLGRHSFRPWSHAIGPREPGPLTVMARATNVQGATQPAAAIFNPGGYHNNVIANVVIQVI